MNTGSAIVVSAVMVAAIYAWRWFTGGEGTPTAKLNAASLAGQGPLVAPEGFLVAWGTIFLLISIVAGFSEALAGSMALSVLLGDVLANGVAVAKGVNAREQTTQPATKGKVKQ